MSRFALASAALAAALGGAAAAPTAAELRRYKSTGCAGAYSSLSTDVMGECAPYLIPAPASIKVEYVNETAYASYHYQGVQDCSGDQQTRELLAYWTVGQCQNFDGYSQMRAWINTPPPPVSACGEPGDCGRAYQACCVGYAATGNPCGCHLHNGTGTATSSDCGTCGKAFVGCCSAFRLTGKPCACDITDKAAAIVV